MIFFSFLGASLTLVLTLVTLSSAQDISLANVKAAFDGANVSLMNILGRINSILIGTQLPTDLQINFEPSVLFEVTFDQSVHVTTGA